MKKLTRKKGFDHNKKQLPNDPKALMKIIYEATKKLKSIEFKQYSNPIFNNNQVGNYESAIKSGFNTHGDTLIPGGFVKLERGDKTYKGLKREIPTAAVYDLSSGTVTCLVLGHSVKIGYGDTELNEVNNQLNDEFNKTGFWPICDKQVDSNGTPLPEFTQYMKDNVLNTKEGIDQVASLIKGK